MPDEVMELLANPAVQAATATIGMAVLGCAGVLLRRAIKKSRTQVDDELLAKVDEMRGQ